MIEMPQWRGMLLRKAAARTKIEEKHPYLHGNFAPTYKTCPLTPCTFTGSIPSELAGGQYVRNGSNPVSNEDLGRDAHWFDGDGMLSGVLFERTDDEPAKLRPSFVNQFIVTDILQSHLSTPSLRRPMLPSIATLVNPLSTFLAICFSIFRAVFLVFWSHLPGSRHVVKKISVANTAILYHDGRALATCESGPPMRIALPSLDTIGWYNGRSAEGEVGEHDEKPDPTDVFGGEGLLGWMKEWSTAHPKVDPVTNEMILYHSMFAPPYMHYSIIPAGKHVPSGVPPVQRLLNHPVAGVSGAKMMHDFGVSRHHTIVLDLPLTLDPLMQLQGRAPISYDRRAPSRFGVFPRREPSNVRYFETDGCCIFHTANCWDILDGAGKPRSVEMLACRSISASVVFNAGNIAAQVPGDKPMVSTGTSAFEQASLLESKTLLDEEEQCRLYYFSFDMQSSPRENKIAHQFGLSKIPFEFPSVNPAKEMVDARYVYGCSTSIGNFNSALGRVAKIDAIAKFDAHTLVARGKQHPPTAITGCVDNRSIAEVMASDDPNDPIKIFHCPPGVYAQEPRFIARKDAAGEDDGYLIFYTFDEAQLDATGEPGPDALSELWLIDAKNMADVIFKVRLPQRVPYGLHGSWFDEKKISGQRPFERRRELVRGPPKNESLLQSIHAVTLDGIIKLIGG